MRYSNLRQVPPRSFTRGRPAPPRLIVVHDTEGSEHAQSAEDGAAYDQRRTDGTSAHYFVDSNSVVQCVDTNDQAHTARRHGNMYGIQYELCGKAGQSRAQWLDSATITNAARQIARDMKTHSIPLVRLVGRDVRNGRGICGHVDCTNGWPEDDGDHTDPGPRFPWDFLFSEIKRFLNGEDEDVPLTPAEIKAIGKEAAAAVWATKIHDDWLTTGVAVDQVYRYLTKEGEIRVAIINANTGVTETKDLTVALKTAVDAIGVTVEINYAELAKALVAELSTE